MYPFVGGGQIHIHTLRIPLCDMDTADTPALDRFTGALRV